MAELFISGLTWHTDNAALRAKFEEFGNVDEAEVIKDDLTSHCLGFGFVRYTTKDDADAAVSAMNNVQFGGQTIRVDKWPESSLSTRGSGVVSHEGDDYQQPVNSQGYSSGYASSPSSSLLNWPPESLVQPCDESYQSSDEFDAQQYLPSTNEASLDVTASLTSSILTHVGARFDEATTAFEESLQQPPYRFRSPPLVLSPDSSHSFLPSSYLPTPDIPQSAFNDGDNEENDTLLSRPADIGQVSQDPAKVARHTNIPDWSMWQTTDERRQNQVDVDNVAASDSATLSRRHRTALELLDDLARRNRTLFSLIQHHRYAGRSRASGGSNDQNSLTHQSSIAPIGSGANNNGRKHRRENETRPPGDNDNDDDDDDENEERRKRQQPAGQSNSDEAPSKRHECVYRIKYPSQFAKHKPHAWISRLQKHLHVSHEAFVCNQCLIKFPHEEGFESHKHGKACKVKSCWRCVPLGMELFGECDHLIDPDYRWLGLYHLCFPESELPTDPAIGHRKFPRLYDEITVLNMTLLSHGNSFGYDDIIQYEQLVPASLQFPDLEDMGSTVDPSQLLSNCHQNQMDIEEVRDQLITGDPQSQHLLDEAYRRIELLQQRLKDAEEQALQHQKIERVTKSILDKVWVELKTSGHPEAEPGQFLANMVATVLPQPNNNEPAETQLEPQSLRSKGKMPVKPRPLQLSGSASPSVSRPRQSYHDPMISGGLESVSPW